jgi:hypothetical protein
LRFQRQIHKSTHNSVLHYIYQPLRGARTRRSMTVFATARNRSLSWASRIQFTPPANLPKIHSDSILPSTSWPPEWSLSFGLSHQNLVHFPVLSQACHMSCPPHSPWLDLPNYIWGWIRNMKLLNVTVRLFSRQIIPPPKSKYSQNPVPKHPQSTNHESANTDTHRLTQVTHSKANVGGRWTPKQIPTYVRGGLDTTDNNAVKLSARLSTPTIQRYSYTLRPLSLSERLKNFTSENLVTNCKFSAWNRIRLPSTRHRFTSVRRTALLTRLIRNSWSKRRRIQS